MPKVSIVVPVYNVEEYLRNTLDSIISQSLQDIEIILVNDGSNDSSGIICDEYAKKDYRICVIHQKNQGVCVARNQGINIASGEYIGFCDADDEIDMDMYEFLYKNAINNQADISMCAKKIYHLNGKEQLVYGTENKYLWKRDEALTSFFDGNIFGVGVVTKLIKRDICKSIKFVEGRKVNEDKFFVFQAILNAKEIYFEDKCKYSYLKRDNSASTAPFDKKLFDTTYFADEMCRLVAEENMSEQIKNKALKNNYLTKMSMLRRLFRNYSQVRTYRKEIGCIRQYLFSNRKKVIKDLPRAKSVEVHIFLYLNILYRPLLSVYDFISEINK